MLRWFVCAAAGMLVFAGMGCGTAATKDSVAQISRQAPTESTASVAQDAPPGGEGAVTPSGGGMEQPHEVTTGEDVAGETVADDPYAVVKRFAFTGLQIQRMARLQEPEVHKTLGLTAAQIERFAACRDEVAQLRNEFQKIDPATWEQTIERVYVPVAERYSRLIEEQLTPEQQFQLLQLVARRQRGAIALLMPGVPEHLELTAEQHRAICQIVDRNRRNANFDGVANNPLEIARLLRVMSQARAEAESHLTPEQLRKWQALLGK